VLLAGCTYAPDPDQVFFKNIPINENPEVKISLKDYDNESTINIYGPTTFIYDYESNFGILEQLQISINDNILLTSANSSGTFTVNGNLLVNGSYQLKILVQATSNTGSIADMLNLEKFVVWKTWKLNIDITPPPPPEIFISEENGFLKVSWTGYSKPGFVHYLVSISSPYTLKEFRVTDLNTTSLPITDYVGGYSIECRVTLVTTMHSISSQPANRTDQLTLTGEYRFSDSTMLLTWSKADFSGAFQSYTIRENGQEKSTIYTIQDTTLRVRPTSLIYGESVSYQISLNAMFESYSPVSNIIVQEKLIDVPIVNPMPDYFSYNKTLQSTFGYFNTSSPYQAIKYSDPFMPQQTITSGSFSFATPYESPYIYITDLQHGIVQLNLETQEKKYIDILPFATGGIFNSVYVASASRNQIVTFGYRAHDATGQFIVQHVRVYDMINQLTLYHAEFATGGNELIPTISEDGQYLRRTFNSFYKINGTSFQFMGQPVSTYGFLGFRQDASNEFMLIFNNVVNIYDSETTHFKRAINPPAFNFVYRGYDPVTHRILYAANNAKTCYAIHVDTGVATPLQAFSRDVSRFYLINGYLVHREDPGIGTYLKVINE
jgi:hypothetical protein